MIRTSVWAAICRRRVLRAAVTRSVLAAVLAVQVPSVTVIDIPPSAFPPALQSGATTLSGNGVNGNTCRTYVAVAAGAHHSLAVASDGTVWAWGLNDYGQLGDGTTTNRTSPVQVAGLSGITAVAAGSTGLHSLALGANGTVWAWGYNAFGQLGDGTTTNRTSPVQVSGLSGATAIAAGGRFSLALAGNRVRAWGRNYAGELGDGTGTERHTPVLVPNVTGVTAIGAGDMHSLAVTVGGVVWAWGANGYGQLGDGGASPNRYTPYQIPGLSGMKAVAGGEAHSLAVSTGGSVRAWGANQYGQLGDGTTTLRTTPVVISGITGVTAVAAGRYHSLAVGTGGSARAWGYNAIYQLGDGTTTNRTSPVTVSGLANVGSLAGGSFHSLSAATTSAARGWGANSVGAVGDGTTTNRPTPVEVVGNCPIVLSTTDSPDPVFDGDPITFTVSWTNSSPTSQIFICKAAGLTVSAAITCDDGAWASGTASSSPASFLYTTAPADIGVHEYWIYVCNSSNRCSVDAGTGTFTVQSGFPTITSVTDTPDPVLVGNPITFSATWTDPNVGPMRQASLIVCRSATPPPFPSAPADPKTCAAWERGTLVPTTPATVTYVPKLADIGVQNYYAAVCDETDTCSGWLAGTFTVV